MPRKKKANGHANGHAPDVAGQVPRKLDATELEKRKLKVATLAIAILDLEAERTETAKGFNDELKTQKAELRKLAQEIKTRSEMVSAQLDAFDQDMNEEANA